VLALQSVTTFSSNAWVNLNPFLKWSASLNNFFKHPEKQKCEFNQTKHCQCAGICIRKPPCHTHSTYFVQLQAGQAVKYCITELEYHKMPKKKWSKNSDERMHCSECSPPQKLPLFLGESRPPPETWFLGPTWIYSPNSILIGSTITAQMQAKMSTSSI